jgi:hypothetical protein
VMFTLDELDLEFNHHALGFSGGELHEGPDYFETVFGDEKTDATYA